jgi:hypothetical protein
VDTVELIAHHEACVFLDPLDPHRMFLDLSDLFRMTNNETAGIDSGRMID